MLETIFIYLTEVLSKSWYLALAGSFLWGILSVILSPCHLGSIPLIVAFVNRQGKITFRKAFLISLVFSLGILLSIVAIGFITGLTGRILGNIGMAGFIAVAAIFFIIGLHFLEIIPMPNFISINQSRYKNKGLLSGFLLGIVFGLALGPCTFAFMAPILGIVFNASSGSFIFSLLLVLLYAAGHCLVFIFFGTFSELVQRFLNWDEKAKGTIIVKKIIGIIMILAGAYLLYNNVRL
jgi:cytochrome c-type biogenesis protein